MADGNLKGIGGTAGILSGSAALATVVAAVLGILNQFGIIGSHDAPKPVIVTVPQVVVSTVASQISAAAPSAAPSIAAIAELPHPHRMHRPRRQTVEVMAANTSSSASVAQSPAAPIAASAAQTPAAADTQAMLEPTGPVSIAGAWRDMGIGACHLISQAGAKFDVTNYDPATGEVISQGVGTINGNHVEIDLVTTRRAVSLDLHISPDRRAMYGKVFRIDGPHRTLWNYIGTGCSKPG